jgi:hypothetical protein
MSCASLRVRCDVDDPPGWKSTPAGLSAPGVNKPAFRARMCNPAGRTASAGGANLRSRSNRHHMSSVSAISLSGMNAAQTALGASAHNIANLTTAGFQRQQVVQSNVAGGGVSTSLTNATQAGNAMADDMVGQLVAKNQFLANLAVFKTSDQMMGALLDTSR